MKIAYEKGILPEPKPPFNSHSIHLSTFFKIFPWSLELDLKVWIAWIDNPKEWCERKLIQLNNSVFWWEIKADNSFKRKDSNGCWCCIIRRDLEFVTNTSTHQYHYSFPSYLSNRTVLLSSIRTCVLSFGSVDGDIIQKVNTGDITNTSYIQNVFWRQYCGVEQSS